MTNTIKLYTNTEGRTYQTAIKTKDNKYLYISFGKTDRHIYRYENKRTGEKLKKSKLDRIEYNKIYIDTQRDEYKAEGGYYNGGWDRSKHGYYSYVRELSYGSSSAESFVYNNNFDFDLQNILYIINYLSLNQYDNYKIIKGYKKYEDYFKPFKNEIKAIKEAAAEEAEQLKIKAFSNHILSYLKINEKAAKSHYKKHLKDFKNTKSDKAKKALNILKNSEDITNRVIAFSNYLLPQKINNNLIRFYNLIPASNGYLNYKDVNI